MWDDAEMAQLMADPKTERLSVLIHADLKQAFEDLCKPERRSMSAQVVLLIEQSIAEAKRQGRLSESGQGK